MRRPLAAGDSAAPPRPVQDSRARGRAAHSIKTRLRRLLQPLQNAMLVIVIAIFCNGELCTEKLQVRFGQNTRLRNSYSSLRSNFLSGFQICKPCRSTNVVIGPQRFGGFNRRFKGLKRMQGVAAVSRHAKRRVEAMAAWVVLVKLGPEKWERYRLKSWIEAAKHFAQAQCSLGAAAA
jgi:hypothetical protein